jgi:nucleotide-binding universal stress UspA family protein
MSSGPIYRRLLVPYDGSGTAEQGLQEAAALATRLGAEVRLLTVLDTYPPRRQQMRAAIEAARVRLAGLGVTVDVRMFDAMDGALADFMAKAATEWNADLVVMGTHARDGIPHLFMGSDAELVIRASPVPVLVVPPAAAARGPVAPTSARPEPGPSAVSDPADA